jgi:GTP-binding protein
VADTDSPDRFIVSGRGELHLGILIETMRREGYEFEVSRPEVLVQEDDEGNILEPYETVHVETSPETVGAVVEMLGQRKGQMLNMHDTGQGNVRLTYLVPTRGLFGFRRQFLTATKGMGTLNRLFHSYMPVAGEMRSRTGGSLVSTHTGTSTGYGLRNAEERGVLFIGPGVKVYEGMVVGETAHTGDIAINVTKRKHLTSIHVENKEDISRLKPIREMSLDEAIEYLAVDELLEVTPESYRIRKAILDTDKRNKQSRRNREPALASS